MDAPLQVQVKLCVFAVTLVLSLVVGGTIAPADGQAPESSCVDPSAYARSVVSVTWYFDQVRRDGAGQEIVGERATAWFYNSPQILVTAAHFANELPAEGWQEAELRQVIREGEDVKVRSLLRVLAKGKTPRGRERGVGTSIGAAEDTAILELRDPFPNAQVLDIEPELPATDATVLILGYPGGRMQAPRGIVRKTEDLAGRYAGLTLLEVQGDNRLLLNGGASGAPVLDCRQGRVVAVLNGLLTGPTLPFLPPERAAVPTAWGSPTNTAVPASTLATIRDRIIMSRQ
jgi:hypothetical protein